MSEIINRLREFKKQAKMAYRFNSETGELVPDQPMSENRVRYLFPLYRPPVPSKAVLEMRAVADELLSGKYRAKDK